MKPSTAILALGITVVLSGAAVASEHETARIQTECRRFVYSVTAILGDTGARSGRPNRNVGTAIPLDDRGHLLTMSCVVQGAERIEIRTPAGERVHAELLGCDVTGTIAVLRMDDGTATEPPEVFSLHHLSPGGTVYALGVAPGMEVATEMGTIANIRLEDGTVVIEGLDGTLTSGSPVFDDEERVIGLIAYRLDRTDAAPPAFLAVSMEHAAVLAHQFITDNGTRCGWLGLSIDMSYAGDGTAVKQVLDGSPAAQSGIRPRDIVIGFNDIQIESPGDLSEAVSTTAAGENVVVRIRRSSDIIEFTIRLAARPR